ncbi:carbon-nitrogen hydrolase family protein [Catenuloplanes japonicus]|uniref:carbon-nitrogen hydrolase family protein n=1 Tax=Catenuloplanes japonicus TaxID=33876 RepID=UPI000526ABCD|nr:carbon-nitrogen hydrolase family protein [Catenuloplanes japonicus]
MVRIAACQTPEFLGDTDAALACVERFASQADADLLLFPECFLQGYLVTEPHVRQHALPLDSPEFETVLRRLSPLRQAIVIGLIERAGSRFHNTAVLIRHGRLLGVYRKVHLVEGEAIFTPGNHFPVFEVAGIRVGINICADTRFPDAAAAVAAQGARVLLVPAQNMMRRAAAEHWKDRHHQIRTARARETGMWVISADVTGTRDSDRIGWGPTSVIAPTGRILDQVELMRTGTAVSEIPTGSYEQAPLA